jgi:hypothetical protein
MTFTKIMSAPHAIQRIVPTPWLAKECASFRNFRDFVCLMKFFRSFISTILLPRPDRCSRYFDVRDGRRFGEKEDGVFNFRDAVVDLADVLALAGEKPDAVREGVRVASRISGTGRVMVVRGPRRSSGHLKNAG